MVYASSASFFPDTNARNNNIIIIMRTRPRFREHLVVFPFRDGEAKHTSNATPNVVMFLIGFLHFTRSTILLFYYYALDNNYWYYENPTYLENMNVCEVLKKKLKFIKCPL
jgi:hypothetical protein